MKKVKCLTIKDVNILRIVIIFLFFSIVPFVNGQLNENDKSQVDYSDIRKLYADYLLKKDTNSLKKAYIILQEIDDIKKNGVNDNNLGIVFPILSALEKYDEIINYIEQSKSLSNYKKVFFTNYSNVLKFKCRDKEKMENYVNRNLSLIQGEINENPQDSILYLDYFLSKSQIMEQKSILSEISELREQNKAFSSIFYDLILIDAIKDFYREEKGCD